MSRQAVCEFLDRITSDDDLREQVASTLDERARDPAVVLEAAGEIGLEFSVGEFDEVLKERYGTLPEELSDAELGKLAGGVALFPASSKSGGVTLAFPDVCEVPVSPAPFVPIPYPNTGTSAGTKQTGTKQKG